MPTHKFPPGRVIVNTARTGRYSEFFFCLERLLVPEGTTKDVIYGINWNSIYWASKDGFRMQDKLFGPSREAPLTHTHVRFLGGQLVCLDPSSNFVLSK